MDRDTKDWITPKAEIMLSQISGKGLFAKEAIKSGEEVVIWKGEYTKRAGAELARQKNKLVMQWDEDLFSVEDRREDQGYFINHSCDSNLWMKGARTLVAKRDICLGEEITADYALWEADESHAPKWVCNCGSRLCRRKITGKDWRDLKIQERYLNHFSPLINKRIAGLSIL